MVVRHNCGFAVVHELRNVYSLIQYLQHRGREAAGIAAIGDTIDVIKWIGKVSDFDIKDLHKIFDETKYHTFMAHVRYATKGRKDKILGDAHPHVIGGKVTHRGDHIFIDDCDAVIVHNGQVNIPGMSSDQNDSQALLEYYWNHGEISVLKDIPGAYTAAIADKRRKNVIVFRDRHGIHPGVFGEKGGRGVFASEDIAIRRNQGEVIDNMVPGTIYELSSSGKISSRKIVDPKPKYCFFEYNYIADVDSILNNVSVRTIRKILGEMLAQEHIIPEADMISFIPRCPEPAARTYAQKIGTQAKHVFYKKKSERSFQGSDGAQRNKSIRSNLGVLPQRKRDDFDTLKGKTVYVIDDSTIRGNASKYAVEILKKAGVKNVHVANYTPKIGIIGADGKPRGCEYGVDMPLDDNFVVRDGDKNRSDTDINKEIGAEVYYLSVKGMLEGFRRAGIAPDNLCTFCIGGDRPF